MAVRRGVAVGLRSGAPAQPTVVSGSPEAVTDRLLGFLALGFTALNFIVPGGPASHEQSERLAREVIPTLRAAA